MKTSALHLTVYATGVIALFSAAAPLSAADAPATVPGIVSGMVDHTGGVIDALGKPLGRLDGALDDTEKTDGQPPHGPFFGNLTDVVGMALDNRRAELDRLIASVVTIGKLSATQGAELRTELDRLAKAEADARATDDALTFEEALGIAKELDALSARVATSIGAPSLAPLVVPSKDAKDQHLVVTIVREVRTPLSALGNIITGSVDATGTVIDRSGKAVGKLAAASADGGASGSKPSDTAFGTAAFGAQSVVDVLAARRAEIERMIYQAESSGKLNAEKAAAFRFELHVANNAETEARASEGVITFDEAVSMARSLDELSATVGGALGVTLMPFAVKDTAGNPRLAVNAYTSTGATRAVPAGAATAPSGSDDDGFETGTASAPAGRAAAGASPGPAASPGTAATPGTTATPKRPVADDVPSADDFVSAPGGNGSATASASPAAADLEPIPLGHTTKLNIDYTPDNVPATWWPVLDSRRMQIEQAIALAYAKGLLAPHQATALRTTLAGITNSIATTKADSEPITMDQAAVIAGDLDRLSAAFAAEAGIAPLPALCAPPDARLRIVIDNFGNICTLNEIRPVTFVYTLDSRREQLETAITAAVSSGKLSADQGNKLSRWLLHIAHTQRDATTAGAIPPTRAVSVAMEMDLLSPQLSKANGAPLPPLVVGTRLMLTGNQVLMLDETDVRRADIEARINREMFVGRLSAAQAAKLRSEVATAGSAAGAGAGVSTAGKAASPKPHASHGIKPEVAELVSLFESFDPLYQNLGRPATNTATGGAAPQSAHTAQ